MNMGINAAGHHITAFGIDARLRARTRKGASRLDGDDLRASYANVKLAGFRIRYHNAIENQ